MIEKVGKQKIKPVHNATCHCQAIQLELILPKGLVDPRRCDCSFCKRRGTIVASVPLSGLIVKKGSEKITCYTFKTMTAKHYFCQFCGIHTHHQRRSNPLQFAFNIATLEGVNPFHLQNIPVRDGVNHPADHQ